MKQVCEQLVSKLDFDWVTFFLFPVKVRKTDAIQMADSKPFTAVHDCQELRLIFFFKFFSIPSNIFSLLLQLPSFRDSDPGPHSGHPLPPPHYAARLRCFSQEQLKLSITKTLSCTGRQLFYFEHEPLSGLAQLETHDANQQERDETSPQTAPPAISGRVPPVPVR